MPSLHDIDRVVHCPNCGRYIGPVDRCPYCLTKIPRSPLMRFMRYGTLILAILAVSGMWVWALGGQFPSENINGIEKSMNYARIEVHGTVTSNLNVYLTDYGTLSSVSFYIDDGTGQVKVVAYQDVAQEMIKTHKVPAFGDNITIRGATVMWRGGDLKLALSSAEQLKIYRPEPVETNVSALYSDRYNQNFREGQWVTVEAKVSGGLEDMGSFYRFYIGQGEESIVVYLSKDVIYMTGNKLGDGQHTLADVVEGVTLRISGPLKIYGGWELVIADVSDISMVEVS